jgi:hypothetical protein
VQLQPRYGRVPTYCAAVWGAHHVVLVELEVLVEDGRVELHFAVEFVADLLPVGGWLRHGDRYRAIMARSLWLPCYRAEVWCAVPSCYVQVEVMARLCMLAALVRSAHGRGNGTIILHTVNPLKLVANSGPIPKAFLKHNAALMHS